MPCRHYKLFTAASATLPTVGANRLSVVPALSVILSQPEVVTSLPFIGLQCSAEEAVLLQPLVYEFSGLSVSAASQR